MFLPYKLLSIELKRNGCWKSFLQYRGMLDKVENHNIRIEFLDNCKSSDVIPRFLKFRIPNNGCFDDASIHSFQIRLLKNEIHKAKRELEASKEKVNESRETLKQKVNTKLLPSIVLYIRCYIHKLRETRSMKLNEKLYKLSKEQEKPLFNVKNTVKCYDLDENPPKYVIDTLALGPRNSVLTKFDQNDILAELDSVLRFCKDKELDDDLVTDINIKTLAYVKKCKKQKQSRNIMLTKKYLKEKKLLAIPFDKGIGICIMTIDKYNEKLRDIIDLPQFEKVLPKRKNEKHPVLKEEERIQSVLKNLKNSGKITEALYDRIKPVGSQPARLYGLAKIHKANVPLRPILSMPGSAYHKISLQVADWLSVVTECKINSSTKDIADKLSEIELEQSHEIVSFDVVSLYTNVPVNEAIDDCTELLYSGKYTKPPVDKATFKELLTICSSNVLMLTNDGYFRQTDGLAMGSPPAPLLANGWLSKFEDKIRDNAVLYSRYMDDVLRNIHRDQIDSKLVEINDLHPSLKFTLERENENRLPFLDMLIVRNDAKLTSTWYTKVTDTGLTMNYHALAPIKYKRAVVTGLVHRIYRACSTWKNFHESIEKAKTLLLNNQFPPTFFEPIIEKTLSKIIKRNKIDIDDGEEEEQGEKEEKDDVKMMFVEYRGKVSEKFQQSLMKCSAPVKVIFTMRKLRSVMPSLKPMVDQSLRSGIVYKISCPRCDACYVGQTTRHLLIRTKEHERKNAPVGSHLSRCNGSVKIDDVIILAASTRSISHLLTLEALFINAIKPSLNTKDEYRSRALTIKF